MKFTIPLFTALVAFAIAAPTSSNEVAKRNVVTIQQFMSELQSGVKQYTDSIETIIGSLPSHATHEQKKAVAPSVIKQIDGLNTFIKEANDKINVAAKHQKPTEKRAALEQPTLGDLPHDVLGQLNGQPIVLARLLLPVLEELNPALASVLNTLSLEEVDLALQPLLRVTLPALVIALSNLVSGLLAALAPLLASLGGILGPLLLGLGL